MNSIPVLDLIFLIIILVCAIIALIKGFINELFGMGAPVISAWMAILLYKFLVPVIEGPVKIHLVAVVLSFLAIFVVVFIILKIVQLILSKLADCVLLKSLDRILGLVFGLVEGLAITVIILIILSAQPWFDCSGILENSFFARMFSSLIAVPVQSVVNAVNSATPVQFGE